MKHITVSSKAVRVRFDKATGLWEVWHWRKFLGGWSQKSDAEERAEEKRGQLWRDKLEREQKRGPGYREVPI
jgi:hypothetical protein